MAEALTTNKHLEVLNISGNPLCDDGIQRLAQTLQVNHHMKKLVVDNCGVTDIGLECLVKLIQDNNVLNTLSVRSRVLFLAEINILPFFIECFQNNYALTELVLPEKFKISSTVIENAINDVRKRSRLPHINVD